MKAPQSTKLDVSNGNRPQIDVQLERKCPLHKGGHVAEVNGWDPLKPTPPGILKSPSRDGCKNGPKFVEFKQVKNSLELVKSKNNQRRQIETTPIHSSTSESRFSSRTQQRRKRGLGYTVFISHCGRDKQTMAIPLYRMLRKLKIKTFVDKEELPVGASSEDIMNAAMQTAPIGVFIMSPEAAARKWPMKEMSCFINRYKKGDENAPVLIPVFYRLGVKEFDDENLFFRRNSDSNSVFRVEGFLERVEKEETSMKEVRSLLKFMGGICGIENYEGATNEDNDEEKEKRTRLLKRVVDAIVQNLDDLD